MELKCYTTGYSTFGRNEQGGYNEYVSESEYIEVMNENNETFTDIFHKHLEEQYQEKNKKEGKV